jgi:HD superfamily phosphohydrolase
MIDQVLTDIYSNPRYKGIKINPQDVAAIVAPFISPVEGSPLDKHGAHMLCHELVSGELDVDRMDYLLRDSRECGVVYGIFDESRILNSLAVYWDIEQKELHLAIQFSGLAAFEDYLRARHSMYLQLYFHKTSVAAEAMIQNLAKLIENCKLPTNIENYASIDETNFNSYILKLAADQNLDTARQTELRMLLDDLLLNRKLWKRVFEVASNIGPGDGATSIDRAATTIASLGFQFEKVSSSSSLTRFRPRSSDADPRAAALRLIKKDYMQFPRVIPIEDQLSLVDANSHVHITRLYVENRFDTKTDRPIADLVREALHVL